jgi:hypothetical protein
MAPLIPIASQDVVIGQNTYTLSALPFGEASPTFVSLLRVLGPALAEILAQPGDQNLAIARSISYVCEHLSAADLDSLTRAFAKHTQINGQALGPAVNLHFAGRFGELFQFLRAAVEYNFADFFAYAGSEIGSRQGSPAHVTSA